ncbi:DUF4262 domain-containing protein [Pseudomonas luteola]
MRFNTEQIVFIIETVATGKEQGLEGFAFADASLKMGEMDKALDALMAVPDVVKAHSQQLFEMISLPYIEKINLAIESSISEKGFIVLCSDAGFAYTVGLASNRPELYMTGYDEHLMREVLAEIGASNEMSSETKLLRIASKGLLTALLDANTLASSPNAKLKYANLWWKAHDFPVRQVVLSDEFAKWPWEEGHTGPAIDMQYVCPSVRDEIKHNCSQLDKACTSED